MTERWCYTDQFQTDSPLSLGFVVVPLDNVPEGYLDLGEISREDAYAKALDMWLSRSRRELTDDALLATVHRPVDESYRL